MNYDQQIQFVRDVFKNSLVSTTIVRTDSAAGDIVENCLSPRLGGFFSKDLSIIGYLGKIEPQTIYRITDALNLSYMYFLLPNEENKILFIGPYTHKTFDSKTILEVCERNRISLKSRAILEEVLPQVISIPESSHLFMVIDTLAETIWADTGYTIVESKKNKVIADQYVTSVTDSKNVDETLINMDALEQRYEYENKMIEAVRLGLIHKIPMFMSAFSEGIFKNRISEPLRSFKNYCIIMNTLMRKAAEEGGVHPIHLDSMSSNFAVKIESLPTTKDALTLMEEMFTSYCRLVRKNCMKNYSPIIQKAIVHIETDLAAPLTLSVLSSTQNVSPGYLATLFKKETGMTVSEYIRQKRMQYAGHLLATTHLQIQTIALHSGVEDVQYFSKMFKKEMGLTPKEYRRRMRTN